MLHDRCVAYDTLDAQAHVARIFREDLVLLMLLVSLLTLINIVGVPAVVFSAAAAIVVISVAFVAAAFAHECWSGHSEHQTNRIL